MSNRQQHDFELALSAFAMFSNDQKLAALKDFAAFNFPRIEDRFFEAVYRVISNQTMSVFVPSPGSTEYQP